MDDAQRLKDEPIIRTVVIDAKAVWRIREDATRMFNETWAPSVPFCTIQALHDYVTRQGGRPGFIVKGNQE
jgi:hypothetical protein